MAFSHPLILCLLLINKTINMDRPIAITTAPIEIKAYFILYEPIIYLTKGMVILTNVPPSLFDEISKVPLHIISSL